MEEMAVKTKKHLNKPAKIILFVFYSALYILPLFFGFLCLKTAQALCLKFNLSIAAFIGVTLLTLLILIVIEIILYKKTDIPKHLFVLSPCIVVIIGVLYFIYLLNTTGLYYANGDIEFLIFYIIALGIIKAIVDTVRLLKNKSVKIIPLCFVSVVFCFSCSFMYENIIYTSKIGESDRTSSWNYINQISERSENWKEIVTDTDFTLGEITKGLNDYNEEEYYCDKGTFPNIDGSTVCVPMAVEFARQHLNFDDQKSRDITNFSTTHWAYMNLFDKTDCGQVGFSFIYEYSSLNVLRGTVDLVIATHPSEEELKTAEEKGIELILEPVCYDAFVFITHKDNPVESLTVQQIKDIYSGKIKNWKDVGGKNEKIRAFQREANSGSQTAMERLVMGGTDMIDPIEVKVIEGMGELVDAVAEYENETASLGYTYRYYIDNLYKNDEIKTIAVEGVSPTDDNIRSAAYPYTTNYYGVIRKEDENNVGGKFLRWILSEEGQKCVSQAGYIAMSQSQQ